MVAKKSDVPILVTVDVSSRGPACKSIDARRCNAKKCLWSCAVPEQRL
jgi:hypothetical protein